MRIPAFRAVRSFKNGAAPGSTYVQLRIGWYMWLCSMCIVARRDFGSTDLLYSTSTSTVVPLLCSNRMKSWRSCFNIYGISASDTL